MTFKNKVANLTEKNEEQQRIITSRDETIEQQAAIIKQGDDKIRHEQKVVIELKKRRDEQNNLIASLRVDLQKIGLEHADIYILLSAPLHTSVLDAVRNSVAENQRLTVALRSMLVTLHGVAEADARMFYALEGKNETVTA